MGQVGETTPGGRTSCNSPTRNPSSSSSLPPGRRFPGLELGQGIHDMRGMDSGACEPSSSFRTPGIDSLAMQESSELLAQWAQLLLPDEAFEKYLQLDDLDSLLFDCSGVTNSASQPKFASSPESETPEDDSQTRSSSGHSAGDLEIRDDQVAVTASSGSVGANSTMIKPSIGKRKCREGTEDDEGVAPSIQQEHSIDAPAQKKQMVNRGSKRPDKSMRYAIETRSEVDVVDDGFRWRKYGQKPVKNSAHPRNYYRCTAPNCPVRKQVERCTENPRNVLTTYNGTHNHPGKPTHSARDQSLPPVNVRETAEETLSSSSPGSTGSITYQYGLHGPLRSPVSLTNYVPPYLLDHMFTNPLFETQRWPNLAPPLPGASVLSQRNIDLLRMRQFCMMQYQTQYPILSNMLNLMRNYIARPPLLDPSVALLAAQNFEMRPKLPGSSVFDQQASRSASLSMQQQLVLQIQEMMGEKLFEGCQKPSDVKPSTEVHHEGVENVDVGDPEHGPPL